MRDASNKMALAQTSLDCNHLEKQVHLDNLSDPTMETRCTYLNDVVASADFGNSTKPQAAAMRMSDDQTYHLEVAPIVDTSAKRHCCTCHASLWEEATCRDGNTYLVFLVLPTPSKESWSCLQGHDLTQEAYGTVCYVEDRHKANCERRYWDRFDLGREVDHPDSCAQDANDDPAR